MTQFCNKTCFNLRHFHFLFLSTISYMYVNMYDLDQRLKYDLDTEEERAYMTLKELDNSAICFPY